MVERSILDSSISRNKYFRSHLLTEINIFDQVFLTSNSLLSLTDDFVRKPFCKIRIRKKKIRVRFCFHGNCRHQTGLHRWLTLILNIIVLFSWQAHSFIHRFLGTTSYWYSFFFPLSTKRKHFELKS